MMCNDKEDKKTHERYTEDDTMVALTSSDTFQPSPLGKGDRLRWMRFLKLDISTSSVFCYAKSTFPNGEGRRGHNGRPYK